MTEDSGERTPVGHETAHFHAQDCIEHHSPTSAATAPESPPDPPGPSISPGNPEGSSAARDRNTSQGRKYRLVLAAAFLACFIVVVLWRLESLIESVAGLDSPVQLFFWMIGGVGAILASVLLLSIASDQHDPEGYDRGPLGLPHGSVSAILALIILTVFAITSVFLFNELRAGEGQGHTSTGVSAEVLSRLPAERILSITEQEQAREGEAATYQVVMTPEHPVSANFAQNLLTIFSTLLATIVGFYFGQGAVTKGAREASNSPGTGSTAG